jgi:hypothetical protein
MPPEMKAPPQRSEAAQPPEAQSDRHPQQFDSYIPHSELSDTTTTADAPTRKHHFPAERDGCYYQRVEDCCALCYLRLVGAALTAWYRA